LVHFQKDILTPPLPETPLFEEVGIFYRGLILGIMIAAPVGPIGVLCIRRTIQKGLLVGFATGLGAAAADTIFGTIAALGVAAIMDFIRHYDMAIRIIGGAMLTFGAWHTWHDHPTPASESGKLANKFIGHAHDNAFIHLFNAFMSALAITLTNPLTIFAVLAVVATFAHVDNHLDAFTLVTGLFFGSIIWWASLSGGIALVRVHFTEHRIALVNRITASILGALALWAIFSGVIELYKKLSV